jgi:hypothetical protein
MSSFVIWEHGDHRCICIVGERRVMVRLLDATRVVREQVFPSSEDAERTAQRWENEDLLTHKPPQDLDI